jgi:cbb3-type cytochrome oxidase cytochrome c subunit
VFTVSGPGGDEARKFPLQDAAQAICGHANYGPIFGRGHDFYIANECNTSNSGAKLGAGYLNDTGRDGTEVLAGEKHFTVEEIEVFAITE